MKSVCVVFCPQGKLTHYCQLKQRSSGRQPPRKPNWSCSVFKITQHIMKLDVSYNKGFSLEMWTYTVHMTTRACVELSPRRFKPPWKELPQSPRRVVEYTTTRHSLTHVSVFTHRRSCVLTNDWTTTWQSNTTLAARLRQLAVERSELRFSLVGYAKYLT